MEDAVTGQPSQTEKLLRSDDHSPEAIAMLRNLSEKTWGQQQHTSQPDCSGNNAKHELEPQP